MVDIGLDFGSTYSVASYYSSTKGTLVAVPIDQEVNSSIPSVMAIDKKYGTTTFGSAAKASVSDEVVYKAFKMLLGVTDKDKLAEWKYDTDNTPQKVAGIYLNFLLTKVLEAIGEDQIGTLRIGVPEIWGSETFERTENGKKVISFSSNVDSKSKLLRICEELPILKGKETKIKTVSEPVAASAYYAYSGKSGTEPFTGHILLVDYGGGTLDITLTEVSRQEGNESALQIRVPFKTGSGENYDPGKVGTAGLVYIESLARKAIAEALGHDKIPNDVDFQSAVNDVENILLTQKGSIDKTFARMGIKKTALDPELMVAVCRPYVGTFKYRTKNISLTFLQLVEVYEEVIEPVLREKLEEYAAYRAEKKIDDSETNVDHFKFVLAGGFGRFYLVKNQVAQFFDVRSDDSRRKDIFSDTMDGVLAVSYGAALIAAGVVALRQTPPCSIGVAIPTGKKTAEGEPIYNHSFAMLYNSDTVDGQPFSYDTFYPQRRSSNAGDGHQPQIFVSLNGFREFLICSKEDSRATLVMRASGTLAKEIEEFSRSQSPMRASFKVDDQGIFTLKLEEYNPVSQQVEGEKTIRLDRYEKMFETQDMRRAFPNEL